MAFSGCNGDKRRAHVAMIAFPFASHPATLFKFARALAAAAPAASFSYVTSATSLPPTTPPLDNLRVRLFADEGPLPPPDRDQPVTTLERIGAFMRTMPANLAAAVKAAEVEEGEKVSCLVSDAFLCCAASDVAVEMGVPYVAVWAAGTVGLLSHMCTDELRRAVGVSDELVRSEELLTSFPGLTALRVRDLPEGIVYGDVDSGFSKLLHRMASRLPSAAAAVALPTFQGLDPAMDEQLSSKFRRYLPVGPLDLLFQALDNGKDGDDECVVWLDRQQPASVVYVSFSTAMSPTAEEIERLARAVESTNAPFLWSLGADAKKELPEGFLERMRERGLVVPWALQARVLGHGAVGAFLHHGGWNSAMEGMAGEVPMVCIPAFADQMVNARILSREWGIGMALDGESATEESIAQAVEVVLRGDEGERMRERIHEMKRRALQAVDHHSGSSRLNLRTVLDVVLDRE